MAGFREYRPGEVWFYYNPQAHKELESKKALGMLTCRPCVIIQDAFYPEWNDTVTVVPMTSSDRRSGVYIDSTILNDGSMIEGGTILPYLFYNIRCKFLYPVTAGNEKHKLINLAPEDYEKVRNGFLYHLGASTEVPEYVTGWKHLSDYDRNIVIRDIRLAIKECGEDFGMTIDTNPIIKQTPPDSLEVENHVIGTTSILTPDRRSITQFNSTAQKVDAPTLILDVEEATLPELLKRKNTMEKTPMLFKAYDFDELLDLFDDAAVEWMPVETQYSRIFKGSTILASVEPKKAVEELLPSEASYVMHMKLTDIMEKTGVKSMSTASRVRKELREAYPDEVLGDAKTIQAPDPLIYVGKSQRPNRSRCKRNAKRRRLLFRYPKETLLSMVSQTVEELQPQLPDLSPSAIRQFIIDIGFLYPDAVVELSSGDTKQASEVRDELITEEEESANHRFAVWETLSPHEIAEVASSARKTTTQMAQRFCMSKEAFKTMRTACIELSKKNSSLKQPLIDACREKDACLKVIMDNWTTMDIADLVLFCRTDYSIIAQYYADVQSGNTPSKSQIHKLKTNIRKYLITNPQS